MDSQLVVLHFETVESVEATISSIETLEAEGLFELDDAALLTRDASGAVTVTPAGPRDTARKTSVGAVTGLVAGSLLGLPILGALAGVAIRASDQIEGSTTE